MYTCLHVQYLYVLSDFYKPWILLTDFWKTLNHQMSWKSVQWQPSCSMWIQTDRTKLTDAFHSFVDTSKKDKMTPTQAVKYNYSFRWFKCHQGLHFSLLCHSRITSYSLHYTTRQQTYVQVNLLKHRICQSLSYGLDIWDITIWLPAEQDIKTGSGAHTASYSMSTNCSFSSSKKAEVWSWPLTTRYYQGSE